MYRNKRWKDRRGSEVKWVVGDLIDERAMEKKMLMSVYHDPICAV